MPRNVTTTTVARARRAQANFDAAQEAWNHANAERKSMMAECYTAGLSVYDIGDIFGTGPGYIHNVLRAAGIKATRRRPAAS
jgi:hypothetical protein